MRTLEDPGVDKKLDVRGSKGSFVYSDQNETIKYGLFCFKKEFQFF